MRRTVGLLSALAIGAVLAARPSPAIANGRPPSSVKVVFRPGNSSDLLVGVTFGLMVTRDDAATWRWICESAVGFQGSFDPDYEYSSSGAIWATTFDGLRYTRDGCVWEGLGAPLGSWLVTAVAIGSDGAIYAGAADPVLGSGIFKSVDDGATFQPTGNLNQVFDWFETLEVAPGSAPGDALRVYGTGYRVQSGLPRQKLMFRSMNGGQTWESLPVAAFVGTEISDVQIAAVSPNNPEHVYVRVTLVGTTVQEAIYRTSNWSAAVAGGGPTWTKVLDLPAYIRAVVVRRSGEVLAATGSMGLYRSADAGLTFTPVGGVLFESRCLVERPSDQSLWMCANHLPSDLMALGRSATDAAGPWLNKLRYEDMLGPVRCPAGNDQHDDCELNLWCGTRDQFGVTSNEIDCAVDAGIDGPSMPPPKDGCCDASAAPGAEIGMVLVGLMALGRRRRRTC